MKKLSQGRVEASWRKKLRASEKLGFVLLDPDPEKRHLYREETLKDIISISDTILIGGSLNITPYDVDEFIDKIRDKGATTIVIFPGGVSNIGRKADAILYMTLMNSIDPYWIIEAQVLAAPIIKRLGLEAIPTAYLIYGYGAVAGHIGRALPIPEQHSYIVGAYAAAAELLGLKAVYLEAGSGSPKHVAEKAVRIAKSSMKTPILIVGGGIKEPEQAQKIANSGADAIVIGTIVEQNPEKALKILETLKKK